MSQINKCCKKLTMNGFKPRVSGVRMNHSAHWAESTSFLAFEPYFSESFFLENLKWHFLKFNLILYGSNPKREKFLLQQNVETLKEQNFSLQYFLKILRQAIFLLHPFKCKYKIQNGLSRSKTLRILSILTVQ